MFHLIIIMGLSSTIIYTSELILCSTICVPSATRHNIHMYPYFLFAAICHPKTSPTFSVGPCSSVGRVTVDLIRRSWVLFPPRSKDFFFASCGPCFPLLGLTPRGLFMGLSSTIIYISELILCSTISFNRLVVCSCILTASVKRPGITSPFNQGNYFCCNLLLCSSL